MRGGAWDTTIMVQGVGGNIVRRERNKGKSFSAKPNFQDRTMFAEDWRRTNEPEHSHISNLVNP